MRSGGNRRIKNEKIFVILIISYKIVIRQRQSDNILSDSLFALGFQANLKSNRIISIFLTGFSINSC